MKDLTKLNKEFHEEEEEEEKITENKQKKN